jgi:hypothetical protein
MANAVIASGGEDVPSISCAPNQSEHFAANVLTLDHILMAIHL